MVYGKRRFHGVLAFNLRVLHCEDSPHQYEPRQGGLMLWQKRFCSVCFSASSSITGKEPLDRPDILLRLVIQVQGQGCLFDLETKGQRRFGV